MKEIRTRKSLRAQIIYQMVDRNGFSDWLLLNTRGKFLREFYISEKIGH